MYASFRSVTATQQQQNTNPYPGGNFFVDLNGPGVLQGFFMTSHFTVEYSQLGFILKSSSPTHALLSIVHPESNTLFLLFCVTTVRLSIFNKLLNSVMENSWPWISHMVF